MWYKCLSWLCQLKKQKQKKNKKKKDKKWHYYQFSWFFFIVYVLIFPSIIPASPLVNSRDLYKAGLFYFPRKLDLLLTVKLLSFSLLNIAKHNKKKVINHSSFQYILLFMLSRSFLYLLHTLDDQHNQCNHSCHGELSPVLWFCYLKTYI